MINFFFFKTSVFLELGSTLNEIAELKQFPGKFLVLRTSVHPTHSDAFAISFISKRFQFLLWTSGHFTGQCEIFLTVHS